MQYMVLIVEDEPSVREILSWRLTEEGYNCVTVSNGVVALESIQSGACYDLMITDIRMPGMSGLELLKEVRRSQPDMAVIMITAVNDINIAVETLKLGASDYITKPFNLDEVCISCERALEKRNLVLKNREYRQSLEEKLKARAREIENLYIDAIKSLVSALEAKDKYTEGHSRRVTRYALEIAKRMDMPSDKIQKIYLAGLLHDIGKIGVKESILTKPDMLTSDEYSHIYLHSTLSAKILYPIFRDSEIVGYVKHHHERWDGTGRPDGLRGEQIPIGARVLAVADSFDAMTSDRPYRTARPVSVAVNEIRRCAGTQFDNEVVSAFLVFVHESFNGIEYLRPVLGKIFPDLQLGAEPLEGLIANPPAGGQ
ncbi:MAG: response regulator [Acidobacteria bacterium]|nr:response regulator [Acidobacteriota bacterium]